MYRGNGIPLPWGNMAQATDPCPNWALFRMLNDRSKDRGSQISVLRDGERSLLYCCHSRRTDDMAGNPHVLSVGIDLVPALRSHGADAESVVSSITEACLHHHGEARIPELAARGHHGRGEGAEHRLGRGGARQPRAHHLPAQHALPAHRSLRRRRASRARRSPT